MRRKDREVTSKAAIEAFVAKEQILRIAFYDDGDIYIIPVNYGYQYANNQYTFYFHGAKAGRKFELSKANPLVGFEIDGAYRFLEGEAACDFSASFQSVTGTGILRLVENEEEKIIGLNALMKQTTKKDGWSFNEKMLHATAVYRLDVQKLSCKAK